MAHTFTGSNTPRFLDRTKTYLVVDDFEAMRQITTNQLRTLGAEKILVAKDGVDALKVLRAQHVDVVLSDWNMPVMTGLELLKAVRSDDRLRHLPFLMITAEAERPRVEQAVANGVTALVLKPYAPSQLLDRIEKALTAKPRYSSTAQAPVTAQAPATAAQPAAPTAVDGTAAKSERATLLMVDDTHDNLLLLSQIFKEDYRVRLALNGEKALEICQSNSPPDLVLLDIMMPGMDGFEVAKRMREHPTSETIPIIFVTAMTSQDARIKGMDLGAVDFITKPIDPEVLKPRVRNFMRYVQMRRELQADFDDMVDNAKLREDVEHITRHDMKGPLAGVIGLVQGLLEDDVMGRKQIEQLKLIEETMLQVMGMINLSSELFKIETGRFKLNAVAVDVVNILRRLVEINRATFSSKNVTISVDTDVPVGQPQPMALGDAMLCYSLFQNLIKNACEAAPEGTKVKVKLFDAAPLRIAVENRGAVPASIRERFFEKFVTQGKSGGTGLGTYSARMLAQAQQGTVELDVSDDTDTTTLTITLLRDPESVAPTAG
jgi:two-component system sensor histidine kinase/response regulator